MNNIKQTAEEIVKSGQQPTGITLAIVPVVLAASAAVVLMKKRK